MAVSGIGINAVLDFRSSGLYQRPQRDISPRLSSEGLEKTVVESISRINSSSRYSIVDQQEVLDIEKTIEDRKNKAKSIARRLPDGYSIKFEGMNAVLYDGDKPYSPKEE